MTMHSEITWQSVLRLFSTTEAVEPYKKWLPCYIFGWFFALFSSRQLSVKARNRHRHRVTSFHTFRGSMLNQPPLQLSATANAGTFSKSSS